MDKSICPWWDGPCLFEALDAIEIPLRDPNGPFRYAVFEHCVAYVSPTKGSCVCVYVYVSSCTHM